MPIPELCTIIRHEHIRARQPLQRFLKRLLLLPGPLHLLQRFRGHIIAGQKMVWQRKPLEAQPSLPQHSQRSCHWSLQSGGGNKPLQALRKPNRTGLSGWRHLAPSNEMVVHCWLPLPACFAGAVACTAGYGGDTLQNLRIPLCQSPLVACTSESIRPESLVRSLTPWSARTVLRTAPPQLTVGCSCFPQVAT